VIEVIDRFRKPLDQRDREDKVIRQEYGNIDSLIVFKLTIVVALV
jgi:hypothetical protein